MFGAAMVMPSEGYRLKVTRQDYQSWESDAFTVSAGQRVNFRIPLEAKAATKTMGEKETRDFYCFFPVPGMFHCETKRTRPLCAWPNEARYKGTGSIDEAANFTCAAPGL